MDQCMGNDIPSILLLLAITQLDIPISNRFNIYGIDGKTLSTGLFERVKQLYRYHNFSLHFEIPCHISFFFQVTSRTIKLVFFQSQRMRWDKLMNRYEIQLKQSHNK